MDTPKKFSRLLKKKIITKDMLLLAIYSSNKRAKNYRDKEREARERRQQMRLINNYWYDKYDNEGSARAKKEAYYEEKEKLLSVLAPKCIHREMSGYERERIYDYQPEYRKHMNEFVWENKYFDHTLGYEVWFGDIEKKDCPRYRFYLFYDLDGTYTFHTPISQEEADVWIRTKKLSLVDIDHLETEGRDVSVLVSHKFVQKLIALIESKDYTLRLDITSDEKL